MRWVGGHVAYVGEERKVCKVLVGKPKGERSFRTSSHGWEDGIKMDLREIGRGMWSGFTWHRIGSSGKLS
jgi:hypothetical protein